MNERRSAELDENAHLEALGPQLLVKLLALIRTARTHEVSNQLFVRQARELVALIHSVFQEEDELWLVALADYFYLNGMRIRAEASLLPVQQALMAEFERRSLGGVRFIPGLTEPEFERFFQLFIGSEDPAVAERLAETCREASIEHVVPVARVDVDQDEMLAKLEQEREVTERGRAKRVFWRAMLGTKKIMLRARQTGRPDLRHAKRLVQPIVDSVMKHEQSIVGLTALKDHDEYTYAHCVNVSVVSISIGQQLGLARQALADLGVAGLLHDLGKLAVPAEVLRKPAALSAQEWALMRRHPMEGVKIMTRMPGLSPLTVDVMRVAFEHHMNMDSTGYPEVGLAWEQSALSRIVAVADCFDAITAHRVYKRPFSTYEALQQLLGPNRVHFDPAVLWGLLRTVGLYPPGALLVLDSGHVVLSLTPNPENPRCPVVRVVLQPGGSLASQDPPEDWNPLPAECRVERVLPPEEAVAETQEYLAA